ncbi:MAG TPA: PPE domain-containing protein [Pseudonocardiaceae bacterium]|nr:PPE domain-containing protein [Pseudonocardiaceae bacterium]
MGTNFNYDDTDHQVIFDSINGGAGSDSLQETSRAWQQLGDDVGATGKSYVQNAIRGTLASRTGAAAEAAAAATGAMLPWIDDVALIAITAAQRAQGQADHWVTAKYNVPPVPPAPVSAGFFGAPTEWFAQKMDWFPGLTTEEEKAQQRRQDAAEQARQAMRVYQSSSNGNIDPAPVFITPQALDVGIAALPLTDARVDGAAAPAAVSGTGHHATAHQPVAHPMAAYQPVATASQLAQGGPGSVAPGSGRGAGNPTPGQGGVPGSTGFGDGTAGRGSVQPSLVPGGAAGTRIGGGASNPRFGSQLAEPAIRPQLAEPAIRPQPAEQAIRSRPSQAQPVIKPRLSVGAVPFGPQPGVSASPSADEVGGARGVTTAAAAARGIGYGEPFAGGVDQRGEPDREYRSKYLVHDDSHSIVGDLPPTAPPVIGEDPGY